METDALDDLCRRFVAALAAARPEWAGQLRVLPVATPAQPFRFVELPASAERPRSEFGVNLAADMAVVGFIGHFERFRLGAPDDDRGGFGAVLDYLADLADEQLVIAAYEDDEGWLVSGVFRPAEWPEPCLGEQIHVRSWRGTYDVDTERRPRGRVDRLLRRYRRRMTRARATRLLNAARALILAGAVLAVTTLFAAAATRYLLDPGPAGLHRYVRDGVCYRVVDRQYPSDNYGAISRGDYLWIRTWDAGVLLFAATAVAGFLLYVPVSVAERRLGRTAARWRPWPVHAVPGGAGTRPD